MAVKKQTDAPQLEGVIIKGVGGFYYVESGDKVYECRARGVLRGGGDTKFLLLADVLFLWVASIPLGYLCGLVLHWPAWLTMWALRVDFVIKSVWCINRLKSGKWIHSVTERKR